MGRILTHLEYSATEASDGQRRGTGSPRRRQATGHRPRALGIVANGPGAVNRPGGNRVAGAARRRQEPGCRGPIGNERVARGGSSRSAPPILGMRGLQAASGG
ncbi:hypothetical protein LNKW23_47660 [Paralimibaculum aggregatum]|uniref:Uncharacterized protein n=1 Tax=Paralimibaculum aggregatum TaxID=3036245 RepID=A0ABQ6LTZ6_9RHOB|nr:hypothetical protein LNKW23_47660 [Limibaculum sp. NKW23]